MSFSILPRLSSVTKSCGTLGTSVSSSTWNDGDPEASGIYGQRRVRKAKVTAEATGAGTDPKNLGVLLERDLKVIRNGVEVSVPLDGSDSAANEVVRLAVLDEVIKEVDRVVEAGRPNLALVNRKRHLRGSQQIKEEIKTV